MQTASARQHPLIATDFDSNSDCDRDCNGCRVHKLTIALRTVNRIFTFLSKFHSFSTTFAINTSLFTSKLDRISISTDRGFPITFRFFMIVCSVASSYFSFFYYYPELTCVSRFCKYHSWCLCVLYIKWELLDSCTVNLQVKQCCQKLC